MKRVISRPRKLVQNETSCDQETGSGAAARNRAARPQRRACSMVRAFSVLARGRSRVGCGRGSTTTHPTPRRPSSTASARPTGPPPAISTGRSRMLDGPPPGGPMLDGSGMPLPAHQAHGRVDDRAGVDVVDPVGVVETGGLPELGHAEAADAVAPRAGQEGERVRMAV